MRLENPKKYVGRATAIIGLAAVLRQNKGVTLRSDKGRVSPQISVLISYGLRIAHVSH